MRASSLKESVCFSRVLVFDLPSTRPSGSPDRSAFAAINRDFARETAVHGSPGCAKAIRLWHILTRALFCCVHKVLHRQQHSGVLAHRGNKSMLLAGEMNAVFRRLPGAACSRLILHGASDIIK